MSTAGPRRDSDSLAQLRGLTPRGPVLPQGLYIRREADEVLERELQRKQYCCVFAPRQIGKTSLIKRTERRLEKVGVRCAEVDLNLIGALDAAHPEKLYGALSYYIVEQLKLRAEMDAWEKGRPADEPPLSRWYAFHAELLVPLITTPVVIFLDEIDLLLPLPTCDDFFASLRTIYSQRQNQEGARRVTYCLAGVAIQSDLIQEPRRTPFNICHEVRLDDFSREQAEAFLLVIEPAGGEAREVLEAVYSWTAGHPALTQQILYQFLNTSLDELELPPAQRVRELVQKEILQRGRVGNPILAEIEDRFSTQPTPGDQPRRPEPQILPMLRLYRKLLCEPEQRLCLDNEDPLHRRLQNVGLCAERRTAEGSWLCVRNRIFAEVFNLEWVRSKDPDLERERLILAPLSRWLAAGRAPTDLLRGRLLEEATAWSRGKELLTDQRDFLIASQEQRGHLRVRRIWLVVSLFLLALIAAGALTWKWVEQQRAGTKQLAQERNDLQSKLDKAVQKLSELRSTQLKAEESLRRFSEDGATAQLIKVCTQPADQQEHVFGSLRQTFMKQRQSLLNFQKQLLFFQLEIENTQAAVDRVRVALSSGRAADVDAAKEDLKTLNEKLLGAVAKSKAVENIMAPDLPSPLAQANIEDQVRYSQTMNASLEKAEVMYRNLRFQDAINESLSSKENRSNVHSWRIAGSAACYLGDLVMVRNAINRSRKFMKKDRDNVAKTIRFACSKNKITCVESRCTRAAEPSARPKSP